MPANGVVMITDTEADLTSPGSNGAFQSLCGYQRLSFLVQSRQLKTVFHKDSDPEYVVLMDDVEPRPKGNGKRLCRSFILDSQIYFI